MEVHTKFLNHQFTEFRLHIPWASPSHGKLFFFKRTWWDYCEPLLFCGLKVTCPPAIVHCVVHSGTSKWKTLEQISTNYTSHLDRSFNNIHAYEEMLEYMSTYVGTESDWITLCQIIPKKANIIQEIFCGIHPTAGVYLLTRLFGTQMLTLSDCLVNLLVKRATVICTYKFFQTDRPGKFYVFVC